MPGDSPVTPDGHSRPADERSRNGGVRPIRDVLAELFAHYEARFPGNNVTVVEQPSPLK